MWVNCLCTFCWSHVAVDDCAHVDLVTGECLQCGDLQQALCNRPLCAVSCLLTYAGVLLCSVPLDPGVSNDAFEQGRLLRVSRRQEGPPLALLVPMVATTDWKMPSTGAWGRDVLRPSYDWCKGDVSAPEDADDIIFVFCSTFVNNCLVILMEILRMGLRNTLEVASVRVGGAALARAIIRSLPFLASTFGLGTSLRSGRSQGRSLLGANSRRSTSSPAGIILRWPPCSAGRGLRLLR